MQQALIDSITATPAYRTIVASRRRLSFTLTAVMVLTYYGFVMFVAFAPGILAQPLYAGSSTSLGVAVGVGIMLIAIILTGWYVMRSNRTLDPLMHALLKQVGQGD